MAGSLTIDNINGKVISSSPVATESQVIGVGQTWQDVTASRANAITYTNSTGKPIFVQVSATPSSNSVNLNLFVGGVQLTNTYSSLNYSTDRTGLFLNGIIPAGQTYKVSIINSVILKWSELR